MYASDNPKSIIRTIARYVNDIAICTQSADCHKLSPKSHKEIWTLSSNIRKTESKIKKGDNQTLFGLELTTLT